MRTCPGALCLLCWKVHCCWSAVDSKMTKKVKDANAA